MSDSEIGPALPPSMTCVQTAIEPKSLPTLPKSQNEEDDEAYGPSLPPHLATLKPKITKTIGPSLPPQFKQTSVEDQHEETPQEHHAYDEASDDEVGPLLSLAAPADMRYDAAAEFTERMNAFERERNRDVKAKSEPQGREEWMTSLPKLGLAQDIGLTARQFRNKAAPEQDESWTRAPTDPPSQIAPSDTSTKKRTFEQASDNKKDFEIAKRLEDYNKQHRQETLIDMHTKKIKKTKEKVSGEEDSAPARVPFNRETDLQVNRFDEAQRKSVLKKAAQLDSRFGHGSQKYE